MVVLAGCQSSTHLRSALHSSTVPSTPGSAVTATLAGSSPSSGLLIATAPPCPGAPGIYRGSTTLKVAGTGIERSRVLTGPYTVTMTLPAGRYSLIDTAAGTHATVQLRPDETIRIDLGAACG